MAMTSHVCFQEFQVSAVANILHSPFIAQMVKHERDCRNFLAQSFYSLRFFTAKYILSEQFQVEDPNIQKQFKQALLTWIEEELQVVMDNTYKCNDITDLLDRRMTV
jgi:hypothetical protein